MRISMPRGDIKWQRFMVNTPNGTASEIDFTNIYFTVKENVNDRDYIFQKSLQRGDIYKIGKGDYQFKITPADTNKMRYDEYKFDIQIQYKNLIKESFVGDFVLKGEVTFAENEDEEDYEDDIDYPPTTPSTATIVTIPDYHLIQLESPVDIVQTSDYNDLTNIPMINDVKLMGHMRSDSIDIVDVEDDSMSSTTHKEIVVKLSTREGNLLSVITSSGEEGLFAPPPPAMHRLTFGANGEFVYDGSEDVTVPAYDHSYTVG